MNQIQVATAAGLTQSAYSRIESGQTALTVSSLHTIAKVLGLKADEVIAEVDRLATQLQLQGVQVPGDKPENDEFTKPALLIGLGVLLALFASGK